ncbi:isoleucine--tRNA ligase, mitochondrial isoform X1 [Euwallacea fornicatus]|uniref:isoleucine--tRNA ligase, mitochondrial isoform X1 n=2 Tax=Euwallacea fornicatus TaxID=995702 RepID=UPI00338D6081
MLKLLLKKGKPLKRCYCTKVNSNRYSHTVLLPKTKLPLRNEGQKLVDLNKHVHEMGGFDTLYEWQRTQLDIPEYTLHDGPPYANGLPHMGHAINKILKDVILRYKVLDKRKVHYVPGWDCHGLPIELKALSDNKNLDPISIRSKARSFATKTIKKQMDVFKSWGVIGDWHKHYETKNVAYIQNQLRIFLQLYRKGYIYRDIKPIYWSPSSRTALAEAELEYNESHISPSVYVRILVKDIPGAPNLADKRVYAIIWTTTPWTLPCNQAISYNNTISYCLVKKPDLEDKDLYIIATDLYEAFCKEVNCEYQLLGVHSGDMLSKASYIHPIYKDQVCRFVSSSHATNTKGTGLVHTAPAHGPDDFLVGIRNKMTIVDLISDEGVYKPEAGEPFANKYVLKEGNETVLSYLKDDLLHTSKFKHSYPYDWRTKKPVIIKASKQWFVDTNKVKEKAVKILQEDVTVIPHERSEIYKKALVSQLQKRPYWCISRQRKWGVPIPVFYHKATNEPVVDESIIDHLCRRLQEGDTDFWWKSPIEHLLPEEYATSSFEYTKGEDIFDIWFDSGISWSHILNGSQVADLYLEGVDQFQGWFQSSLITSVALRGFAPYKTIFVHGFAVDKNGVKMSKSLGNVVDPVNVVCGKNGHKAYGVNVLRWWVACHANHVTQALVSDNILNQAKDEVLKIRSVLRFAVAALSDYQFNERDVEHLRFSDKYILYILFEFYEKAQIHINNFDFHKINFRLIPLLTNEISAEYFTSIKDRLYCQPANDVCRKSAQFTLLYLFYTISQIVGGILPHLIEECFAHLPQNVDKKTFFRSELLKPQANWLNLEVARAMKVLLEIRREVNKMCELGSSLSSDVVVELSEDYYRYLEPFLNSQFEKDVEDMLQVASVVLKTSSVPDNVLRISVSKSDKFNCPRCRLVKSVKAEELCFRCNRVVNEFYDNKFNFAS